MKKKINQRGIGIILGYINFAVKMIIQLIYVPVMLRLLGDNEYGVYQLVTSVVSYLGILDFGFAGAYLKFYSETIGNERKEERLNSTYMSLFSVMAFLATICGIILARNANFLLGNKLTISELMLAKKLLIVLSVNLGINFFNSVFTSFIISRENFLFQRIINLVATILNPIVTIALLLHGYGSTGMVLVSLVISIVTFFINLFYCKNILVIPFKIGYIDISLIKRMSKFSFFLFINIIIDQINWNMDKFLLGRMVGSSAVAIYSVASQINTIYIQLPDMIASVYTPKINRIVAVHKTEEAHKEINNLLISVGRIQSIVASIVLIGFILFGKDFIKLWVGDKFEKSYYIVLLLIIPAFVPLCQSLCVDIQRAVNKHQFRSLIYLFISLFNVILSIRFIKKYAEIGAALGTTIAMIVGNWIIINIFYHRVLKLNMINFWKNVISIFPSYIPAICMVIIIKKNFQIDTWGKLLLVGSCYCVIFSLSVFLFGLNKIEKNKLISVLKKGEKLSDSN